MRLPALTIVAGLLALAGVVAVAYYLLTLPTILRVAVGPVTSENVRVITAAIQTFQRERDPFRLKLVLTEGSAQSAAALDEGKADLAVVRTDIAYPRSAASVAVMHTDHVIIVAPGGEFKTVADLAGKTIGIVRDSNGNFNLARTILQQGGLQEEAVKLERLRIADLRSALESGRIQAVLAVGPIAGRFLFEVVNTVTDIGKGEVRFLAVPEPSAIEQRNPLVEADTLVRGLFGGAQPRPEKDTPTVTVSYQLLAAKSLSDNLISDFTRVLLTSKAQIAVEAPLAARIEGPDQEKESPIPIHPGTVIYLDGQTTTFFERYGDWFYIAIMGIGLSASALAAFYSVTAARARREVLGLLGELQAIGLAAGDAPDLDEVARLEKQAHGIFQRTLTQSIEHSMDSASSSAFAMAFAEVREILHYRRRELGGPS